MAWHLSPKLIEAFENSRCSQGPAAESLEGTCSAGGQSAQSKTTLTRGMFWSPDKTMEASVPSRSGMTYEPLTESRGEAVLMSYLEAFPVRTSAQPEKAKGSQASDPVYGLSFPASSAKFDRALSSWRIHPCLFPEDSMSCSPTLPRWGTMRAGVLSERTMLGLFTNAIVSGLLPTPTAQTYGSNKGGSAGRHGKTRHSLESMAKNNLWPTPRTTGLDGGSNSRAAAKKRGKWPDHNKWQTPVADDAVDRQAGKYNSRGEPKLSTQVLLFPTPTVSGNHNKKGASKESGNGLSTHVKLYPTPYGLSGNQGQGDGEFGKAIRYWGTPRATSGMTSPTRDISPAQDCRSRLEDQIAKTEGQGHLLNPDWVELLMGWPKGWTHPRPLENRDIPSCGFWDSPDWEINTPRLTKRSLERPLRLRAIGNGQVPLVAATAWNTLLWRIICS